MALWTRERNQEIGILLAIGKSKGRIFAQFLMEILLVSYVFATCPCYWTATKSTVFAKNL
ncbi:MAG: FtsX-like permease family protein [Streptococcus sp.]